MKHFRLTLVLCTVLTVFSCDEQSAPLQCPPDLACTEIFISFAYAPLDNTDEPLLLDTYYSRNLDNGQTYTFGEADDTRTLGNYTVITDAQIEEINATGTFIRFIGVKDGEIVLEQDFLIGHDCCHIVPLEGPGID